MAPLRTTTAARQSTRSVGARLDASASRFDDRNRDGSTSAISVFAGLSRRRVVGSETFERRLYLFESAQHQLCLQRIANQRRRNSQDASDVFRQLPASVLEVHGSYAAGAARFVVGHRQTLNIRGSKALSHFPRIKAMSKAGRTPHSALSRRPASAAKAARLTHGLLENLERGASDQLEADLLCS